MHPRVRDTLLPIWGWIGRLCSCYTSRQVGDMEMGRLGWKMLTLTPWIKFIRFHSFAVTICKHVKFKVIARQIVKSIEISAKSRVIHVCTSKTQLIKISACHYDVQVSHHFYLVHSFTFFPAKAGWAMVVPKCRRNQPVSPHRRRCKSSNSTGWVQ